MFAKKDDLVILVGRFATVLVALGFLSLVVQVVVYTGILVAHPSALAVGIVAYLTMITVALAYCSYKGFMKFFAR